MVAQQKCFHLIPPPLGGRADRESQEPPTPHPACHSQGTPVGDLFSEMTPEPVAAASLGQVYQARLRKEGTVVAVKVQRPFVLETVALDLYLVRLAGLAPGRPSRSQTERVWCCPWGSHGRRLEVIHESPSFPDREAEPQKENCWQVRQQWGS